MTLVHTVALVLLQYYYYYCIRYAWHACMANAGKMMQNAESMACCRAMHVGCRDTGQIIDTRAVHIE